MKSKGVIFDMDNTLLRSSIDFEAMKRATYQFLVARGILAETQDLTFHTTSTLIRQALDSGQVSEAMQTEMWTIPAQFELAGMQDATLEAGVKELLETLQPHYELAIVTNNAWKAAETALRRNEIFHSFSCVVGREQMESLKPAPDGFRYVLDNIRQIPADRWISVGDAWVDGSASAAAGIPFIAYKADHDKLRAHGVRPIACIEHLNELSELLLGKRKF